MSTNDAVNILADDADRGDITVSVNGTVLTIDLGAVTLAKLQNISSGKLLGRYSEGSGPPELISLGTGLAFVDGVLTRTGYTPPEEPVADPDGLEMIDPAGLNFELIGGGILDLLGIVDTGDVPVDAILDTTGEPILDTTGDYITGI